MTAWEITYTPRKGPVLVDVFEAECEGDAKIIACREWLPEDRRTFAEAREIVTLYPEMFSARMHAGDCQDAD